MVVVLSDADLAYTTVLTPSRLLAATSITVLALPKQYPVKFILFHNDSMVL